jgi:NADH-quinone oxidoreductase subunit G
MQTRDAARLGLASGDVVSLQLPGGTLVAPLKVADNMAPGVLVLPRHRQLQWRILPETRFAVVDTDIVKVEG